MKRKNLTGLIAGIMILSALTTGCGKVVPTSKDVKGDLSNKITEITKA